MEEMRGDETWKSVLEWNPDIASRDCTVDRVRAIAFTPMNNRLRNELITRTYYDLATDMAKLVGPDATWTTFGQWASHTIGSFLRLPIPVLGRIIARSFGYGNREVFADIGSAQALFLETVGAATLDDSKQDNRTFRILDAFTEFQAKLRQVLVVPPGTEAAPGLSFWETVDIADKYPDGEPRHEMLQLGFLAYANAIISEDEEERSKFLLLGNSLLALHEQRILALAISMGFRSWLRNLTRFWFFVGTQRKWLNTPPHAWRISLEDRWIRFATRHFVRVDLPWGAVQVGRPVPEGEKPILVDDTNLGPDDDKDLRRGLDVGELNPDEFLLEFHEQFDVDGRPSKNWNILEDRMSYILALFAEHQRSAGWWEGDDPDQGLRVAPRWRRFDRELEKQLARMTRTTTDTPIEVSSILSDAELDDLRTKESSPKLTRSAREVMMRAAAEAREEMNEVDLDVRQRLAVIREPGQLLDDRTVSAAQRVFDKNETLVYVALFLRSLPDAYAAARGVQVIAEVSDLNTDPMRRAAETAQFIADVLQRSPEISDNPALRSVIGVRFMHSIAAKHLEESGWDIAVLGEPVNQEDVLATALSFSVPVFEMFDIINLPIDRADRDAYVRFWLGIGHLLGAPDVGITTYEEGLALARHIRQRQRARSLSGVRLTEGLLDGVGAGFTRGTSWMAPGLMRIIGDDEVVKLLMVGEGRGRRRSELLASMMRFGLGNPVTRGFTRWLINTAGKRSLVPYFALGSGRPFRRPLEKGEGKAELVTVINRAYWP